MYAQVLTPKEAETFKYNVLDLTKFVACVLRKRCTELIDCVDRDWGFDDVPRTEIGKFYLTENPAKFVSLNT